MDDADARTRVLLRHLIGSVWLQWMHDQTDWADSELSSVLLDFKGIFGIKMSWMEHVCHTIHTKSPLITAFCTSGITYATQCFDAVGWAAGRATEWWGAGVLSFWSKVQACIWPIWCHCHSLSLASVESRLVLPFWYRLTWVVPDKGLLNGCTYATHFVGW